MTLASIGDAIVTTDTGGRVTFLNPVAETLTGWSQAEAEGMPLDRVFRIVNRTTRETVESPTVRALRDGVVVGFANHTADRQRRGTVRKPTGKSPSKRGSITTRSSPRTSPKSARSWRP